MLKYILIGILIFLVVAIAYAPASVVKRPVENAAPDVVLLEPRGTIWDGQADLLAKGVAIGKLNWQTHLLATLTLTPAADWQLNNNAAALHGTAGYDFGQAEIVANGEADVSLLNDWLNAYDIFLTGDVTLDKVSVELATMAKRIDHLAGDIHWTGGQVRYNMGGLLQSATLPPMTVSLTTAAGEPRAVLYAQGDATPLIIVNQTTNGFVKIGMTKRFTRLLNKPWPGSDPDHVVVLEVEEQLL